MSTLIFTGVSQVVLSKGLLHLCGWGLHHKELVMFRPVKGSVKIDPQHSRTRVGLRCPRLRLVTCSLDKYVSIASDTTGTVLGVERQQWERGTLPCVRSFYSLLESGRQVLVWRLLRKAETMKRREPRARGSGLLRKSLLTVRHFQEGVTYPETAILCARAPLRSLMFVSSVIQLWGSSSLWVVSEYFPLHSHTS